MTATGIEEGPLLRSIAKGGKVGESLSDWAVRSVVEQSARQIGIERFGAHDLRRTCAKLCRKGGGDLEQIKFLLGHSSIQTTERYLGVYVRMNDGAGLERVAREIIRLLTSRYRAGSATLFPLQMYLEEAFYMEEKYSEAIAQGTRNFELFERVLGRDHQLTLATKAAAEGQLELYDAAVRDDLMLYKSEQSNPSGRRMEEGSLNDAALFECHGGHFAQGIEHARQVIRETSTGPSAQPLFANGSMFTVGECLIAEQEAFQPVKKASLDEAEALIRRVDLKSIQELSGNTDYEGMVDVALARLALLRGQTALAKAYAARAEPFFLHTGSDPYERKALDAVKRASTRAG